MNYARIYWLMIRNSLIREMSFKANFLLWMAVEFLWFLGQIVFIEVLFQYVDRIGDWSKWQVVLLFGTHQLTAQLFHALFFTNLANFPELVRTGRLDLMLLLPVDPQFAVSTRQFGFDNIVNAAVGVVIVVFALFKLQFIPSALQVALYALAVLIGVGAHYGVLFFLATLSFWVVRAQGLVYGYFNLFNVGRYPDVIFHGAFRMIFSFGIPVILVANVPARILLGQLSQAGAGFWTLLGATAFLLLSTRLFFTFALRRYGSASS